MEDLSRRARPEILLTDAATVAIDAAKGNAFRLETAASRTLGAPGTGYAGQAIHIRWKNTGGSPVTLTLAVGSAGAFRYLGSANALNATAAGATEYIVAIYNAADDRWDVVAYSGADFPNYAQEIIDARGDRSQLGLRIATISNFASPNAGGIIVGNYYDNAFQGTASSTLAGAANRFTLVPFYTSQRLRIDQLGVACSTAVASAQGKCVIYGSDADGWPDALLLEPSGNLDFGTTGYKSHSVDFTFDSGRQYWLGLRESSTATIRSLNLGSAVNLGVNGSNGSNYFSVIRRTLTYANAAPDPFAFVAGDLVANITPISVRMRAAALP